MQRILGSFFDEIAVRSSIFKCNHPIMINLPATVFRWCLVTLSPIAMGVYIQIIIERANEEQFTFDWNTLSSQWPLLVASILFLLGIAWGYLIKDKDIKHTRIDYVLEWLYEDLGFGDEHDVRCAIWSPKNSKVDIAEMKVVQVSNYYPPYEKKLKNGITSYIKNQRSGRTQPVIRKIGDEIRPVGLVGQCIMASLDKKYAAWLPKIIGENDDFYQIAKNEWNFNDAEIRRLKSDRKYYLAVALMDRNAKDILGVLFINSKTEDFLSEKTDDTIELYLPRIGKILTTL